MSIPRAQTEIRAAGLALRDAASAFYSQMYYWGRDVRHPDGNLLTAFGFTRIPKTVARGTSRYRCHWGGGLIELHGFCAGWYPSAREEPGILFHRPLNALMLWRENEPPDPLVPGGITAPASRSPGEVEILVEKVRKFMEWVREYETWALDRWGLRERGAHHAAYLKLRPRRWWLPPGLSLQWMREFADSPLSAGRPKAFAGQHAAATPRAGSPSRRAA